jgi:hypothetical protein
MSGLLIGSIVAISLLVVSVLLNLLLLGSLGRANNQRDVYRDCMEMFAAAGNELIGSYRKLKAAHADLKESNAALKMEHSALVAAHADLQEEHAELGESFDQIVTASPILSKLGGFSSLLYPPAIGGGLPGGLYSPSAGFDFDDSPCNCGLPGCPSLDGAPSGGGLTMVIVEEVDFEEPTPARLIELYKRLGGLV